MLEECGVVSALLCAKGVRGFARRSPACWGFNVYVRAGCQRQKHLVSVVMCVGACVRGCTRPTLCRFQCRLLLSCRSLLSGPNPISSRGRASNKRDALPCWPARLDPAWRSLQYQSSTSLMYVLITQFLSNDAFCMSARPAGCTSDPADPRRDVANRHETYVQDASDTPSSTSMNHFTVRSNLFTHCSTSAKSKRYPPRSIWLIAANCELARTVGLGATYEKEDTGQDTDLPVSVRRENL